MPLSGIFPSFCRVASRFFEDNFHQTSVELIGRRMILSHDCFYSTLSERFFFFFKTVIAIRHRCDSKLETANPQVILYDVFLVLHDVCLVRLLFVSPSNKGVKKILYLKTC